MLADRLDELPVGRRHIPHLELERAVRQRAEAVVEVGVDGAGVDQVAVLDLVAHVREVGAQAHLDPGVGEDPLEHRGVALGGHLLEPVGEVAVVVVGSRRHPRRDRRVQLRRVALPVLPRVAAEELLVQLAPDLRDDDILARPHLLDRLGAIVVERRDLLVGLEREVVELVDRRAVDRDRQELAVHARHDPVLVGPPVRELRQVFDGLGVLRVEDVRAVAMDEHAVLVVVVVGVAGNVVAPVDHQHPLVALRGEPLGDHRPGVAGADDEHVEGLSVGRPHVSGQASGGLR